MASQGRAGLLGGADGPACLTSPGSRRCGGGLSQVGRADDGFVKGLEAHRFRPQRGVHRVAIAKATPDQPSALARRARFWIVGSGLTSERAEKPSYEDAPREGVLLFRPSRTPSVWLRCRTRPTKWEDVRGRCRHIRFIP
jgi:hypothetical protein